VLPGLASGRVLQPGSAVFGLALERDIFAGRVETSASLAGSHPGG
jgi:hypothetical protein